VRTASNYVECVHPSTWTSVDLRAAGEVGNPYSVVPKIEFLGAGLAADKTIDAPDGGELVDLCDEYFAPVPFSCRSASCGTCHVAVLEGAALLEEPGAEEQELLELLKGPRNSRLACQARVRPGPGHIKLRPLVADLSAY
jgi:ferredoxin